MDKLFSSYPWEPLDEPGFGLFMGSAWAEVRIIPGLEEEAAIQTRSRVVLGVEITPDLMQFLLQENTELLFGAFALNPAGDILFEHTILGSSCDKEQFQASVMHVLKVADDYDDRITEKWGGKRALDIPPG